MNWNTVKIYIKKRKSNWFKKSNNINWNKQKRD